MSNDAEIVLHPEFCFSDASLYYQIDNTLFGIHYSMVAKNVHSIRSEPGDPVSAMTLPHEGNVGCTLLSPFMLPSESGISVSDLEYFLGFLYSTDIKHWTNPSLEAAIAVLHLSHKLACPTGTDYARTMLTRQQPGSTEPVMRPALQVYLGRTYEVLSWLHPAFDAIMSRPLKNLSREDMYALGPETYRIISLGQEACFQKRLKLVCHLPPIIHAPECLGAKQNRKCEQGYTAALSDLQAEILGTKPPVGLPARPLSVIGHLLTAANLGLSDERCGLLTLNAIKESKAFEAENLIMNRIIEEKLLRVASAHFGTLVMPLDPVRHSGCERRTTTTRPTTVVVQLDLAQLDASGSDSEWLQDELEQAAGGEFDLAQFHVPPPPANNMASHDADIWLPQVEPNEQIVYVRVNGLGHRRTELPAAGDLDDITTRNLLLPRLNPLFARPHPRPSPASEPTLP
ncbi:hypothetical protein FRC09_003213 [Ceratobasidium sp. 395]|nr:hypothetical protein FRC09_003213 [Ceratobasidium sp. 395]